VGPHAHVCCLILGTSSCLNLRPDTWSGVIIPEIIYAATLITATLPRWSWALEG